MLRNKKGFTILELLVVVAVIAILAAVTIPSFIGKIDKAKDSADIAEINAVQKAVALYYVDNGNYPTLQGTDVSLAQPQPIDGGPQNVDFSKLVPNYLGKLPHFSYWWVDYKGLVYHTQKPIGNVASNVFTPTTDYTYTLYKGDGSTQDLSGAYTFLSGEYVLGKDEKGRDLPKISGVFKNEKMHPESPEYTGTGTGTTTTTGTPATVVSGVDAWGNPVNMSLWSACKITDAEYGTVGTICLNSSQSNTGTGYLGTIIDGKIEGQIPTKVKLAGETEFIDVTSLYFTFANCSSLTTAPIIPSSVTNMRNTFDSCSALTTAPLIPNAVTNMDYTFFDCRALTTAPVIPSSVTAMDYTFCYCSNLAVAPAIPSSVATMESTFYGCTSLK